MITDKYEINKIIYTIINKFNTAENGFITQDILLQPNTVILDNLKYTQITKEIDDYFNEITGILIYIDLNSNIYIYDVDNIFDLNINRYDIFKTTVSNVFLTKNSNFILDNKTIYSNDFKIAYFSFEEIPILDERVELIYDMFFRNNVKLKHIIIPSNVKSIMDYAFENCTSLSSIEFKTKKLLYIGQHAFNNCKNLITIDLNNVQYLDHSAFENCKNLSTIKLHSTLENIEAFCFQNNYSLSTINLENTSIKILPYGTFNNCSSIISIQIPYTIETVDISAFHNCVNLSNINFEYVQFYIDTGIYNNQLPDTLSIIVPDSLKTEYIEKEYLLNKKHIISKSDFLKTL